MVTGSGRKHTHGVRADAITINNYTSIIIIIVIAISRVIVLVVMRKNTVLQIVMKHRQTE